jgi:hypothetical protein
VLTYTCGTCQLSYNNGVVVRATQLHQNDLVPRTMKHPDNTASSLSCARRHLAVGCALDKFASQEIFINVEVTLDCDAISMTAFGDYSCYPSYIHSEYNHLRHSLSSIRGIHCILKPFAVAVPRLPLNKVDSCQVRSIGKLFRTLWIWVDQKLVQHSYHVQNTPNDLPIECVIC